MAHREQVEGTSSFAEPWARKRAAGLLSRCAWQADPRGNSVWIARRARSGGADAEVAGELRASGRRAPARARFAPSKNVRFRRQRTRRPPLPSRRSAGRPCRPIQAATDAAMPQRGAERRLVEASAISALVAQATGRPERFQATRSAAPRRRLARPQRRGSEAADDEHRGRPGRADRQGSTISRRKDRSPNCAQQRPPARRRSGARQPRGRRPAGAGGRERDGGPRRASA